jgi:hypothetical protein
MSTTKEAKINENKSEFNEKYSTKFNKENNNFNERINDNLNQQQDAINKTLDNTLHNVKRSTDEARREIPQYTQRIAEYQEKTIQTIKDIASDVIESQKQVVDSFQSQQQQQQQQQQVNGNNSNSINFSNGLWWDLYNPQRIAENNAAMVNNFTSYLLNASNLINNTLASNMRVYNTALEQTRDNVRAFTKTNTNYIKSAIEDQQESVNRHNTEINTSTITSL